MKIETGGFAMAAKSLDEAKEKLGAIPGKVEAIKKTGAENLKNDERTGKRGPQQHRCREAAGAGVDLDAMFEFKEEQGDPWQESGMRFIEEGRDGW